MEEPNIKYMSKEEIRNIDPSQIVSIRMTTGSVLILKQGNNQEENDFKKENMFKSNDRLATGNNSSIYVQEGVGEPCKHCGKSYRIFEVNNQDNGIDSQNKEEKEKIKEKELLEQSNEQIEEKKENGEKMDKKVEIEAQYLHEEKKEEKEVLRGVEGKPLLNDILTGEELVNQENNKDEQKPEEKVVDNNIELQEQEMNQNEINKTGEKEEINQNDYREQEQFQHEEENNDKNYNDNQIQKEEVNQNDYLEQEQEQFQHQEEYNEQEQQPEYPPEEINNENIPEQQPEYPPEEINNENTPEQQVENLPQEINNENKNEQEPEKQQKKESIENQEQQPIEPTIPQSLNQNKNPVLVQPLDPQIPPIKNPLPETQVKKTFVPVQPIKPQIQQSIEPTMAHSNKQKINNVPKQFPGKKYIGRGFVPSQKNYIHSFYYDKTYNKGINMTHMGRIGEGFHHLHNIYGSNRIQGRNIAGPMGSKGAYSHKGFFRPGQKKLLNCKRMFTPIGTIEDMALIQGAIYPKTYIPSRRIGLQSANTGTARTEVANFENQKRVLCPECAALECENSYQNNYTEYSNKDKAHNIDEDKNKYCSQTYQAKTKDFIKNYKFHEIVDTSDKTKTHVVVKKGGVIVSSDK